MKMNYLITMVLIVLSTNLFSQTERAVLLKTGTWKGQ